jgi:hypothetical protein
MDAARRWHGHARCALATESAIIDEWMSLPESERLSEQQAAQFALQMKRKYPFDYVGGDAYLEIRRMMMRHQNRIVHSGILGRIADRLYA